MVKAVENNHGLQVEKSYNNYVKIAVHLPTFKQNDDIADHTSTIDEILFMIEDNLEELMQLSNNGYAYIEQKNIIKYYDAYITTSLWVGNELFASIEQQSNLSSYKYTYRTKFYDINHEHWAAPYIYQLAEIGIIQGSNGLFRPKDTLTRAEFAAMISRTLLNATASNEAPFLDIKNHWAAKDIAKLYELGIIQGVSATNFNPKGLVTREQAVAIRSLLRGFRR